MKIKPILFNTEMIRAILAGRKSVTRRVVKAKGEKIKEIDMRDLSPFSVGACVVRQNVLALEWIPNPYCPNDILYVRETWQRKRGGGYLYKADTASSFDLFTTPDGRVVSTIPWNPSIHMPKEAARLFLRVTNVRVERLQEITELQILEDEGVRVDFPQPKPSYLSLAYTETRLKPAVREAFSKLWDSTIKKADLPLYGWAANPWVWVIEFERINKEEVLASE